MASIYLLSDTGSGLNDVRRSRTRNLTPNIHAMTRQA
jgi:hypothetical protein